MKKRQARRRWIGLGFFCFVMAICPGFAAEPVAAQVEAMAQQGDYLGARVLIRQTMVQSIPIDEWVQLRTIVFNHPQIGIELVLWGDKMRLAPANAPPIKNDLDANMARADELMLAGKYDAAFVVFQKSAQWLKNTRISKKGFYGVPNAQAVYPFLLHGMARALFSSKRFDEALKVYSWIPRSYPQYRQVLFEKMWAAFRAGRVSIALGAIASQRSVYFSKYLEPEAYLVQIYLYKSLCRDEDLNGVLREIAEFKTALTNKTFGYAEWAKSEAKTRALLDLMAAPMPGDPGVVPIRARQREQELIKGWLQELFARNEPRLLDELTQVEAYSKLALIPGMNKSLKPIEKIPERAELLHSNLEIWPADNAEEWIDEIGRHQFIGESLCGRSKHS